MDGKDLEEYVWENWEEMVTQAKEPTLSRQSSGSLSSSWVLSGGDSSGEIEEEGLDTGPSNESMCGMSHREGEGITCNEDSNRYTSQQSGDYSQSTECVEPSTVSTDSRESCTQETWNTNFCSQLTPCNDTFSTVGVLEENLKCTNTVERQKRRRKWKRLVEVENELIRDFHGGPTIPLWSQVVTGTSRLTDDCSQGDQTCPPQHDVEDSEDIMDLTQYEELIEDIEHGKMPSCKRFTQLTHPKLRKFLSDKHWQSHLSHLHCVLHKQTIHHPHKVRYSRVAEKQGMKIWENQVANYRKSRAPPISCATRRGSLEGTSQQGEDIASILKQNASVYKKSKKYILTNKSPKSQLDWQLQQLQTRDITPEDFDLLLILDEHNRKTLVGRSTFDSLPKRTAIEDSAELCPICFERFMRDNVLTQLGCGHEFHRRCIKQWLLCNSNSCPMGDFEIT